jgi:hypothetical protein
MRFPHSVFDAVHNVFHRHYTADKDSIGVFMFCESRVPRQLGGRVRVTFSPDFAGARCWPVPYFRYEDGSTLLPLMLAAGSAHQAMALLRDAYAEAGA